MTIPEVRERCKSAFARIPRDVLFVAILILASLLSFGLGYLAGQDNARFTPSAAEPLTAATGTIVASKNGTKYYLPSCAGADRISDANKVWFASAVAAVRAGYSPASNCEGL